MRAVDEAALICDFAQFYNIYDFDQVPLRKQAILACGLPEDARMIRKMTNQKISTDKLLMMACIDAVRDFHYQYVVAHSKKKKPQRPKSLLSVLQEKKKEVVGYDSEEEFEAAKRKILGG